MTGFCFDCPALGFRSRTGIQRANNLSRERLYYVIHASTFRSFVTISNSSGNDTLLLTLTVHSTTLFLHCRYYSREAF